MESFTWLVSSIAGGRGDSDFGDNAAVPCFRRRQRSLRVSDGDQADDSDELSSAVDVSDSCDDISIARNESVSL